jgi:hypothetical protein
MSLRWTTLRYGLELFLALQHFLGDVQGTIAGVPIEQVGIPVVAGTDDI